MAYQQDCPHGDPLHYDHEGCPSCYEDYRAIHSRDYDNHHDDGHHDDHYDYGQDDNQGDGRDDSQDYGQDYDGKESEDDGYESQEYEDLDYEDEVQSLLLTQRLNDGVVDLDSELAEFGVREGALSEYPTLGEWKAPTDQEVKDAADAFQGRKKPLNELVFQLSGVKWGVCDWGSCQYATAQAMFDALRRLESAKLDPLAVVGWGSSVVPKPLELKAALHKISATFESLTPEKRRELEGASSIDAAFGVMRECGWDLCTAATRTAQLVFGTTFEHIEARVDASPGRGSAVHIMNQSDNYTTALRCYALWSVGYVKDPVAAFGNFNS